MADLKEKLVCIKFYFKLEKSSIETLNTLKVAFETKSLLGHVPSSKAV
jgi:hypothetical protein